MTQSSLGAPLTRAFVSSVEHGRTIPSIPALALLADRLEVPLDEFFSGVKEQMTVVYTPARERRDPSTNPTPGRRR